MVLYLSHRSPPLQMKQTWQTLNLPKFKPPFPKPISCSAQMHEMLPIGASSGAIRVAMDLGKCRRAWADGVDVVRASKKYSSLFDQYISWLDRCGDTMPASPPTFVWKDFEDNVIASADVRFEHAMNHFTMGLIDAYTGNAESAASEFSVAMESAARVPTIPGAQFMRYTCMNIESIAKVVQRAARIQELTVLEDPKERAALATALLKDFPRIAVASKFREHALDVKHALFEHMMMANMQVHADEDEFSEAHVYATILHDEPNMRFFESMALTARQSLIDVDEWISARAPATTVVSVVTATEFMGFDSVAPVGITPPSLKRALPVTVTASAADSTP